MEQDAFVQELHADPYAILALMDEHRAPLGEWSFVTNFQALIQGACKPVVGVALAVFADPLPFVREVCARLSRLALSPEDLAVYLTSADLCGDSTESAVRGVVGSMEFALNDYYNQVDGGTRSVQVVAELMVVLYGVAVHLWVLEKDPEQLAAVIAEAQRDDLEDAGVPLQ
ncbi:hypothetical protein A6M27_20025 [Acidithiobacillus thiooxidans]|uniref:Uncharacterized protein n=1 Tax=Acidithiobacillus thiooxidans TaxID=930 RepID=A0A1C2IBF9_ACITH|nr:hypothetical protein [Acidithiobacillus thiooxidans]OCX73318.1 hypothetical protein A6O24_11690 [Acidithiobacillus thiooxidans]OCX77317.1 hypothetical protein A6P07_00420 [Acidithiobacillus thiooxidans]OCX78049.1 hypothetical protein A6O26_18645 [Acidithiobacillus thiooxidans]OCX81140.1 hypothetical protein A6M27_20025 [Acidithiobacillus thiooxidans]OFC41101.1 hypothetical protein BAE47_18770 [Acidithiobacillus thiooxidans]